MKILLIPSCFFKAEGRIAKGIIQAMPNDEIYFFSAGEIPGRMDEFLELLNKMDIVHWIFNLSNANPHIKNAVQNTPCPSISTVHHICPGEEDKIKTAQMTDVIQYGSKEWLDVCNDGNGRHYLAHYGLDPSEFSAGTPLPYSTPFKIGVIGFYENVKGRKRLDVLLDSLLILNRKKIAYELVLQGYDWEKYEDQFKTMEIPYRILGYQSDASISNFYKQIHCYVCTADWEGGPLPLLEALHHGVACLSTPVGLSMEILPQGGGLLCDKNNPEQVAAAIQSLIENPDVYERFQKEGPPLADKFYWRNLATEYETLYRGAVRSWENKNQKPWEAKNNMLPVKKQRSLELAYDTLPESAVLVSGGRKAEGLKKYFKAFINPKINARRKLEIGLRIIKFI